MAAGLLSAFPQPEIVAAEPVLLGLMAGSHCTLLWAGASLINGASETLIRWAR
jgi:hypothetical protein